MKPVAFYSAIFFLPSSGKRIKEIGANPKNFCVLLCLCFDRLMSEPRLVRAIEISFTVYDHFSCTTLICRTVTHLAFAVNLSSWFKTSQVRNQSWYFWRIRYYIYCMHFLIKECKWRKWWFILTLHSTPLASSTDAFSEMHLLPEPLFIVPTDNIGMVSVTGTSDGRIFLAGQDGCLHEVVYQVTVAPGYVCVVDF